MSDAKKSDVMEKQLLCDFSYTRKNCLEALELLSMLNSCIMRIDNHPREAKNKLTKEGPVTESPFEEMTYLQKISSLRNLSREVTDRTEELYHILDDLL
jgi:hypothetical protein